MYSTAIKHIHTFNSIDLSLSPQVDQRVTGAATVEKQ
jgi:hypothetical protein